MLNNSPGSRVPENGRAAEESASVAISRKSTVATVDDPGYETRGAAEVRRIRSPRIRRTSWWRSPRVHSTDSGHRSRSLVPRQSSYDDQVRDWQQLRTTSPTASTPTSYSTTPALQLYSQTASQDFVGPQPVFGIPTTMMRSAARLWANAQQRKLCQTTSGCRQAKMFLHGPDTKLAGFT